jgi:hypothetical protein
MGEPFAQDFIKKSMKELAKVMKHNQQALCGSLKAT